LLLEEQHDVLHIPARDHLKRDADRLALDLHVGAGREPKLRKKNLPGQDLENIHDHTIKHVFVLGAEVVESVEHDQLDVVVGLLDDKFGKSGSGGCESASSR
jgi:hypothetical protein